MRILWINDEVVPPSTEYTQIFGFEDFKTEIDYNGLPNEIWFSVKEGYRCAEYLVNYCKARNYATPKYHLQQMKLEEARKIIYLIEEYNLKYIREHGISEENLLKHFVDIIGNTNIEDIGSITYAINKHEKELESLLPLEDTIRNEVIEKIDRDNQEIVADLCQQFLNYDTTIKEYIKANKFAKETQVPTKVSELENDSNFISEHQDISNLATKNSIPTKVSQLENDSNFISEHQSISHLATKEYVNNALASKLDKTYGMQEIEKKADKKSIPMKTSQMFNDAGFITVSDISGDFAKKSYVVESLVDFAKMSFVLKQIEQHKLEIDKKLKDYIIIDKSELTEDGEYKLVSTNGSLKLVKI